MWNHGFGMGSGAIIPNAGNLYEVSLFWYGGGCAIARVTFFPTTRGSIIPIIRNRYEESRFWDGGDCATASGALFPPRAASLFPVLEISREKHGFRMEGGYATISRTFVSHHVRPHSSNYWKYLLDERGAWVIKGQSPCSGAQLTPLACGLVV